MSLFPVLLSALNVTKTDLRAKLSESQDTIAALNTTIFVTHNISQLFVPDKISSVASQITPTDSFVDVFTQQQMAEEIQSNAMTSTDLLEKQTELLNLIEEMLNMVFQNSTNILSYRERITVWNNLIMAKVNFFVISFLFCRIMLTREKMSFNKEGKG